ncbi:MAG TPA: S16 family serine protease [Ktedonobacteraceae bacterium]|nr:S16 family serine protease [Ktedonobacteraceae bacterium]
MHTVILPKKNEQDLLEDLPKELRDQMRFVFATDIRDVLDAALEPGHERAHRGKESANGNGHERATKRRKTEKAAAKA